MPCQHLRRCAKSGNCRRVEECSIENDHSRDCPAVLLQLLGLGAVKISYVPRIWYFRGSGKRFGCGQRFPVKLFFQNHLWNGCSSKQVLLHVVPKLWNCWWFVNLFGVLLNTVFLWYYFDLLYFGWYFQKSIPLTADLQKKRLQSRLHRPTAAWPWPQVLVNEATHSKHIASPRIIEAICYIVNL